MKTTKHCALTTLLVVAATLSASTPAWAQIDLTPTGAEPGAAGQASSSHVKYVASGISDPTNGIGYEAYTCTLSITCQGLTPGATYATSAGTFKASRDGTGSAQAAHCTLTWYSWVDVYGRLQVQPPRVQVYRVNSDGSYTLVLWAALSSPWF